MFDIGLLLEGIGIGLVSGVVALLYVEFKTNLVQNWLFAQITDIMEQLPAILAQNPEIIRGLVGPLLAELQSGIGQQGDGSVKLGGYKIPGPLVMMAMQMFGGMMQRGASGGATNAAVEAAKSLLNP